MELSPVEREFVEMAIKEARRLNRPFLTREVFHAARKNGYELNCTFDARFVRAGKDANNRPLWKLDEDPERLQRAHLAGFFSGCEMYARRCYDLATSHASNVLATESSSHRKVRSIRSQLETEYLQSQGWS